jgi:hypothetical protein
MAMKGGTVTEPMLGGHTWPKILARGQQFAIALRDSGAFDWGFLGFTVDLYPETGSDAPSTDSGRSWAIWRRSALVV